MIPTMVAVLRKILASWSVRKGIDQRTVLNVN